MEKVQRTKAHIDALPSGFFLVWCDGFYQQVKCATREHAEEVAQRFNEGKMQ